LAEEGSIPSAGCLGHARMQEPENPRRCNPEVAQGCVKPVEGRG